MGELTGLISGVLTVTTLVMGGLVGLQLGLNRTLKESNTALRARDTEHKSQKALDDATIGRLQNEVAVWSKAVTGEAQLIALGQKLDEHHEAAMVAWANIAEALDRNGGHA